MKEPQAKDLVRDYDVSVDPTIDWACRVMLDRKRYGCSITHEMLCRKLRVRGEDEEQMVRTAMTRAHAQGRILIYRDADGNVHRYELVFNHKEVADGAA